MKQVTRRAFKVKTSFLASSFANNTDRDREDTVFRQQRRCDFLDTRITLHPGDINDDRFTITGYPNSITHLNQEVLQVARICDFRIVTDIGVRIFQINLHMNEVNICINQSKFDRRFQNDNKLRIRIENSTGKVAYSENLKHTFFNSEGYY